MKVEVIESYRRPYENPIAVTAGELVSPDFGRQTDLEGWVWCTASDGRSGWTPHAWLVQTGRGWRVDRDFNAIELTITSGEQLDVSFEESGFFWATRESGEAGWVPCENVSIVNQT